MPPGNVPTAPGWEWGYGPAPMPYWSYYWYSPCYPFASCSSYQQFQALEKRRERFDALGREQTPRPRTRDGFPLGSGGGTTASEADVQPDYAGSGKIREQYRKSGEFLPDFLSGKVRPSN